VRMDQQARQRGGWSWWYLLLLVQFVAVLWPPFYNRVEPSLVGLPFFYWYQLRWSPSCLPFFNSSTMSPTRRSA
jgi:Protein of unknown function (DUF3311)